MASDIGSKNNGKFKISFKVFGDHVIHSLKPFFWTLLSNLFKITTFHKFISFLSSSEQDLKENLPFYASKQSYSQTTFRLKMEMEPIPKI
jgi:hypothetical protein